MTKSLESAVKPWRRTKIIATLGPASSQYSIIEQLALKGVDVFRINFSHGEHIEISLTIENIRAVEKTIQRPLSIMGDIQGPKFRIGLFEKGKAFLEEGKIFIFDSNSELGNSKRVCLPHARLVRNSRIGDKIAIDDGRLLFEVLEAGEKLICKNLNNGYISDRKGICFGNRSLDISCIDEKDKTDIKYALDNGFDWLALSFVQNSKDIIEARKLCGANTVKIAAKIERSAALNVLDEIIESADGIMIARGDLGIENGIETIPALQKNIIRRCRIKGVPCIIATQMLETMVQEPVPTRAEVNDVAGAVFDQADAVMLSAETAVGKYPVQAVNIMARVIEEAEKAPTVQMGRFQESNDSSVAIACAACKLAEVSSAEALVTYSGSGLTARKLAAERPITSIISLVPDIRVARQLALVWGVRSSITGVPSGTDDLVDTAVVLAGRLLQKDNSGPLVITAGIPSGSPGKANLIRLVMPTEFPHSRNPKQAPLNA